MDTYIKDNPLIVALFCLLILIYCFVVLYGRYLQRKKYDVTKMSKEELDSMSYADKCRLIEEAFEKLSEAPRWNENKKAKEELNEVLNALGVDHKI